MWLLIIVVVIVLITILGSSNTIDTDIKRITEFVFGPCDIKPYKKYSKEELKEKLGLFDKNIYLKDFSSGVMHRGEIYFYENKLENYSFENGVHKCIVNGTNKYDVSLKINEDNNIEEISCNCPHYNSGNNCKHIYALLYKLKCAENKNRIIKIIETQIVPTSILMVRYFEEYCKNKLNFFSNTLVKDAVTTFDNAINEINDAVEQLNGKNTEDTALNILKTIYDTVYEIREAILSVLNKEKERIRNVNMQQVYNEKKDTESLLTTMFIIDSLNKDNQPINKSNYSEKEMDYYGLNDFEKDLVRKGEYAPWDFEHEDTVEGDYYHYD